MFRIISFGKTDCGLRRSNNEDAFFVKPEFGFCLVADGMGGAAAGELASQIFSETALEVFSTADPSHSDPAKLVQQSFILANGRILKHADEIPEHKGMGCTAELMAFSGDKFILGHMGDSRTYRFKNGQLKQLSQDHSLVQEQLDKGLITTEEARKHAMKNVILRAVGVDETPALDLVRGNLSAGDLFLLCSDGLSDMVEDADILAVLASTALLTHKAEKLVELAKAAGGHDNITVVLIEIYEA
ncbi:MAG: Stp1/IreP family PP2C-type Ser/Thr phosphatase [Deltaproteobacteria bacterium]|nr:Stp1/IreP family PP2C-type Ser/Thr phosphatase [Deltaproteobacteria bacterium]